MSWRLTGVGQSRHFLPEVLVDVYARAEDWRRVRCEGQEGEIRIAALGLSLPLREVYADVLADLGD